MRPPPGPYYGPYPYIAEADPVLAAPFLGCSREPFFCAWQLLVRACRSSARRAFENASRVFKNNHSSVQKRGKKKLERKSRHYDHPTLENRPAGVELFVRFIAAAFGAHYRRLASRNRALKTASTVVLVFIPAANLRRRKVS